MSQGNPYISALTRDMVGLRRALSMIQEECGNACNSLGTCDHEACRETKLASEIARVALLGGDIDKAFRSMLKRD